MRFYVTETLGPKRALTPEGFLICFDVPIARIGTMDYAAVELPGMDAKDGVIEIERTEDEVFRPETIASFEMKPVTIDHPYDPVTPDNWTMFAKGVAKDIRRGEGDQKDLLLADLLITDKRAINEVQSGLREVSCGYDAQYEQVSPGRGVQRNIVGNHIALVERGRCGPICSIGDSHMAVKKPARQSFADKLRKLFMSRDADEFEKTLSEMPDETTTDEDNDGDGEQHIHIHMPGTGESTAAKPAGDEANAGDDPMSKVTEAIAALTETVQSFGARLDKLEAGDGDDDSGDGDGDGDQTQDDDDLDKKGDKKDENGGTNDSATLRNEFQDAKARAEILAPGVNLPTFDAKAGHKKFVDSLCVLRRRALRAAQGNDNAEIVKNVTSGADVAKMTCDSIKGYFIAASELVKHKNMRSSATFADTGAGKSPSWNDINKRNAEFWDTHK